MAEVQSVARLGEFGVLLNGQTIRTGATFEVRSPYDGVLVATVHYAGPKEIDRAIADAAGAFAATRTLPGWKREAILAAIAASITERREALAHVIALEAGKPIKTARLEVDRAAFTFRVAAEETKRIHGEILALDWLPGTERREAHVRRVPLGPIAGITPFNFPLLLVAHKVAPAMAAGNPVIIRPGERTPVSALMLGQMVLDAGWPKAAHAVIPCTIADTALLVEDVSPSFQPMSASAPKCWRTGRRDCWSPPAILPPSRRESVTCCDRRSGASV